MKKRNHTRILLLCVVLMLSLLAGCGKAAEGMPYDKEAPAAEPMEPEMAYRSEIDDYALTTDASAVTEEAQSTAKPNFDEKIIYSGYLRIETTEFDKAVESVAAMITEFGGFIETSEVDGNTRYNSDGTTTLVDRSAYYTLRVPCERFQEFLKRSGSIGNVLSSNTTAENITSQFTDAEARKTSLAVQEERLLSMMEQTTDIDSLIALESRLSEVRYEREAIERQLINWQNSVDYSTVTLNLTEVEIYTPVASVNRTFGEKLTTAFADGWNSFVDFGKRFVLWLAEALPTLLLLALLTAGIILLVRTIRRRRKAKMLPYAQPVQPQDENKPQ